MSRRLLTSSSLDDWAEPVINLTPLIDVVFVVLIAFIVVAPLLNHEQVELVSGKRQGGVHQSPIAIFVTSDHKIVLNGDQVSLDGLVVNLQKMKALYPGEIPQLFQDKRANFGSYYSVKEAAEKAGYERLDLILVPLR